MKPHLLFASALLVLSTSGAFASAVLVKKQAKEVARPGSTTPPSKGAPAGAPATVQANPGAVAAAAASTSQQQAISKLKGDIAVLKSKKELTPELKSQFTKDLAAAADGATKPSPESVAKLGGDLAAALVDKKIASEDVTDLAKSLAAMLNGANNSPAEIATLTRTTREILVASGVAKQDIATIAEDLKAIVGELQKAGPKSAGK